jgi:hypothetical protein
MMKLSRDGWESARSFLYTHARPLEQKLFSYHFENGSRDEAVKELSFFQNDDGGFGNSLEPDFRLQVSSPMATTAALQIAKELDLGKDHPIIMKALTYLEGVYDHNLKTWHAVPPEVNDVPHAPWWHFDTEKGYSGVQTTWANPNAEIVGYFYLYDFTVPSMEQWINKALAELEKLPMPIEMHDFLCYSRLLQCLPEQSDVRQHIYTSLSKSLHQTVCKDPAKWNEYVAKPLGAAPFPSSPFYEELMGDVALQLMAEIDSQHIEGYWQPAWSWFGQYEDTWKSAEIEWRGILTLATLRSLEAFGKINK